MGLFKQSKNVNNEKDIYKIMSRDALIEHCQNLEYEKEVLKRKYSNSTETRKDNEFAGKIGEIYSYLIEMINIDYYCSLNSGELTIEQKSSDIYKLTAYISELMKNVLSIRKNIDTTVGIEEAITRYIILATKSDKIIKEKAEKMAEKMTLQLKREKENAEERMANLEKSICEERLRIENTEKELKEERELFLLTSGKDMVICDILKDFQVVLDSTSSGAEESTDNDIAENTKLENQNIQYDELNEEFNSIQDDAAITEDEMMLEKDTVLDDVEIIRDTMDDYFQELAKEGLGIDNFDEDMKSEEKDTNIQNEDIESKVIDLKQKKVELSVTEKLTKEFEKHYERVTVINEYIDLIHYKCLLKTKNKYGIRYENIYFIKENCQSKSIDNLMDRFFEVSNNSNLCRFEFEQSIHFILESKKFNRLFTLRYNDLIKAMQGQTIRGKIFRKGNSILSCSKIQLHDFFRDGFEKWSLIKNNEINKNNGIQTIFECNKGV